jgi:hypothetical protein
MINTKATASRFMSSLLESAEPRRTSRLGLGEDLLQFVVIECRRKMDCAEDGVFGRNALVLSQRFGVDGDCDGQSESAVTRRKPSARTHGATGCGSKSPAG